MLYPRESETREVKDLSGIWRFRIDPEGEGRASAWHERPLEGAIPMPVPASYNDVTQDPMIRDHVGDAWYEREFFAPASWKGRRVTLRVGAASHRAVVWVNGREVMRHKGGFLPFAADVSDALVYDGPNRVTVLVDNVLDMTTLPPGEVKTVTLKTSGRTFKIQDYQHDFFNYAGLHRPVKLVVTPEVRIEDVTVVTDVKGSDGLVRYEVHVAGGEAGVSVRLLDDSGAEVASSEGASGEMVVPGARLWEPGAAYLYALEVKALDGADGADGADAIDVYRLPVGIRTVKVEGARFLVNGRPFYFRGFGKHEDMDVKGKGLDEAMVVKDMNLLRWIGANSFRTSHYPYAEEWLDAADREGIVVIDEAPAVGMYIFKGKQDVFTGEAVKPLLAHHLDVMEEMVARDRNHPSVVMWSVANECATQEKAFGPYFEKVFARTRELDPQKRPVTIVVHTWFDNDLAVPYADVICLNRYNAWYGNTGQLDTIEENLGWELRRWWEHQGKPVIMSEYGADTIAGLHRDPPAVFSEEYQVEFLKRYHALFDSLDFVIGEHVWNFADFMTKQGITRVDGNRKGVFTRQRQPKAAAHLLRERWTNMKAKW